MGLVDWTGRPDWVNPAHSFGNLFSFVSAFYIYIYIYIFTFMRDN